MSSRFFFLDNQHTCSHQAKFQYKTMRNRIIFIIIMFMIWLMIEMRKSDSIRFGSILNNMAFFITSAPIRRRKKINEKVYFYGSTLLHYICDRPFNFLIYTQTHTQIPHSKMKEKYRNINIWIFFCNLLSFFGSNLHLCVFNKWFLFNYNIIP